MQFILTLEGGDPILEEEVELEMVRARNDKGHYIADDPDTEVNEAWEVRTKKGS
jgi:hypothetical protein